jgi:hypothetical protein
LTQKVTANATSKDFEGVCTFLRSRSILPESLRASQIATAKKIHAATYSLLLWRFRLRPSEAHRRVFVEELASDALQILPQALMAFNKATKLLNRSIIENVFRHLYFADHPVEFKRMHLDRKWYVPMAALKDYAKTHPLFKDTESKFGAISNLIRLYSELSEGVHGSRVEDLEMRVALQKIKFHEKSFATHAKSVEKTTEATNFVLAAFHNTQFRKFAVEDRRTVLRTMPPKARQVLVHLE